MDPFPPLAGVQDIREDQRRLDRLEHLAQVEGLVERDAAAVVDIEQILASPPLGNDALGNIGARAGDVIDFDLGIGLLKCAEFDKRAVAADGYADLPLLLGSAHRAIPLGLPL